MLPKRRHQGHKSMTHCNTCGRFSTATHQCTPPTPKTYKTNYVNQVRSKQQRKARYCYLRHLGFNRALSRRIASYSDNHIKIFLENNQERLRHQWLTQV
jgi:hypothetical protein